MFFAVRFKLKKQSRCFKDCFWLTAGTVLLWNILAEIECNKSKSFLIPEVKNLLILLYLFVFLSQCSDLQLIIINFLDMMVVEYIFCQIMRHCTKFVCKIEKSDDNKLLLCAGFI